jgi:hypothetical protein
MVVVINSLHYMIEESTIMTQRTVKQVLQEYFHVNDSRGVVFLVKMIPTKLFGISQVLFWLRSTIYG